MMMTTSTFYKTIEEDIVDMHKTRSKTSFDTLLGEWMVDNYIDRYSFYTFDRLKYTCPDKLFSVMLHCEKEKLLVPVASFYLNLGYTVPSTVIKDMVDYPGDILCDRTYVTEQSDLIDRILKDKDYTINMVFFTNSMQDLDGQSQRILRNFNSSLDPRWQCRIVGSYYNLTKFKESYFSMAPGNTEVSLYNSLEDIHG